ncbi:MAG: type II secretion system F family protein [Novosphingobium sp.]
MSPLLIRLVILVAIFASVFLFSQLVVGSYLNRRAGRVAVNRRLTLLRSEHDRDAVNMTLLKNAPPILTPEAGLFRKAQVGFIRMVMMSALPVETRTLCSGMAVGFCALATAILTLAWSAKFILTAGVVLLVLVISGAAAIGLPILFVSRLAQRRRKRMEEQFPLALDVFTRALRAGHPVSGAIFLITEEMEDPIGSEFGLVSDEIAYGADLTDALLAMAERWNLGDMRMFVVSVSVQSETGGNLAEILDNLSQVIRARASLFLKVRALSSEGRMSALMLTALPVLSFLSMFLVSPKFYLDVAQDKIFLIGFPTLLLLYAIGVLIMRRMVDLKV